MEATQEPLYDSIKKHTILQLSESSDRGAGSSSSAPYAVIVDLRTVGPDSHSGSSEHSNGSLCEGDESELRACEFSELILTEVPAYDKMAKRGKKCELCPFRGFSQAARLIGHIKRIRAITKMGPVPDSVNFDPMWRRIIATWRGRYIPFHNYGGYIARSESIFRRKSPYLPRAQKQYRLRIRRTYIGIYVL